MNLWFVCHEVYTDVICKRPGEAPCGLTPTLAKLRTVVLSGSNSLRFVSRAINFVVFSRALSSQSRFVNLFASIFAHLANENGYLVNTSMDRLATGTRGTGGTATGNQRIDYSNHNCQALIPARSYSPTPCWICWSMSMISSTTFASTPGSTHITIQKAIQS